MENEIVTLKGTVDGVRMLIDSKADIMMILEAVRKKIKAASGFFKGKCNIYVVWDGISKSNVLRLTSVMSTLYPEANIIFGDVPEKNVTEDGEFFIKNVSKENNSSPKDAEIIEKVFNKVDIGNEHIRFYTGDVHMGEEIDSDESILIFGTVERGAKVTSAGNVFVVGKLLGVAEAGKNGDEKAIIAASKFSPQGIIISKISVFFNEIAQENAPEIAFLMNRTIFVNEIL